MTIATAHVRGTIVAATQAKKPGSLTTPGQRSTQEKGKEEPLTRSPGAKIASPTRPPVGRYGPHPGEPAVINAGLRDT